MPACLGASGEFSQQPCLADPRFARQLDHGWVASVELVQEPLPNAITATFLAVVFVMVVKPSGLWSAVLIAVIALLGVLSGIPFSRPMHTGRRASAADHVAAHGGVESHSWTRTRS